MMKGLIVENAPKTALAEKISDVMETRGVSIKDLAIAIDITYEHARRIVRGESIPSRFLLRAVCSFLEIDQDEADQLAATERVKKTFGGELPTALTGKDPSLEPMERIWSQLTPTQQQDLISLARSWVRRNKAEHKPE